MDFLDLTLETVEENLALDESLLLDVEQGQTDPLLRIWESPSYAIVLGASGRIAEDVDLDRCREDQIPIARRSSGGGTVVIGPGALCFTVILPRGFAPGMEAVDLAQIHVLERVARSLSAMATPVEVAGSGDLVVSGRKISGSAQRRLKQHFFVHASVLYDFDLQKIWRYTKIPARQPAYRAGRGHEDFVTNLGVPRSTLEAALRSAWGVASPARPPTRVSFDRVRSLVEEKFGRDDWVYRL